MKNESGIEQINLGYNDQEDRLLLKLGLADKTEIAVWITRRVCKNMGILLQATNITHLPTITPLADKSKAIETFTREASEQKTIENMDFKSEYIGSRQARTDEPMFAMQCVMISSENQPPHLELQCKNGQAVKIALNNELVHALTNMIQLATREAGWDLLTTVDNAQINLHPAQQVLH